MEYNKDIWGFYILCDHHNNICNQKNIKIYDNTLDLEENINKYKDFKETLIKFLNKNSLISFLCLKNLQ